MDIHEPLPDPEALSPDDAVALRHRLLTRTRPFILRRLTALRAKESSLDVAIERTELELRLAEIDAHDIALDAAITSVEEPRLPQAMPIDLDAMTIEGPNRATARAGLFYSPEAKFNVHGPIMLLHAAALAERLLAPGETFAMLESVGFSRMVIDRLDLTVVDIGAGKPAPPADAAIAGVFRLSSGRRLAFHGVPAGGDPVTERCWINRIAAYLTAGERTIDPDRGEYRFHTPPALPPDLHPVGPLAIPAQLMTVADTLVMMMLTQHVHADETRLLLSIRELPMGAATLRDLVVGTSVLFVPHVGRARRTGAMTMMPIDIRFDRFPDIRTRIMVGESTEPYYRMPVG